MAQNLWKTPAFSVKKEDFFPFFPQTLSFSTPKKSLADTS